VFLLVAAWIFFVAAELTMLSFLALNAKYVGCMPLFFGHVKVTFEFGAAYCVKSKISNKCKM
jgi:hypothetical protein